MGGLCSGDDFQAKSSLVSRKRSLSDPEMKRTYQHQLQCILNSALDKFSQRYSITEFLIRGRIGKGGQGEVFHVQIVESENDTDDGDNSVKTEKRTFAMKRVPKNHFQANSDHSQCQISESFLLEKTIMSCQEQLCPFISSISYSCQDSHYFYYIMDLAVGGDVYSLIHSEPISKPLDFAELGEDAVRFLLAGCVLGLEFLHSKKIVYRDLKPQNILIYANGYPKLADFGVAKLLGNSDQNQDLNSNNKLCYQIKGTVLYLAPQILKRIGYDFSVDLWALGVLAYELLFKSPPFSVHLIKSTNFGRRVKDLSSMIALESNYNSVSEKGKNFISSLLKYEPSERLGYKSFEDIKSHQFFKGFDWEAYSEQAMKSPLKPIVENYPLQLTPLQQIGDSHRDTVSIESYNQQQSNCSHKIPFTFVRARPKFPLYDQKY